MKRKSVAIIGGGASGMMAAIFASCKCDVTIFEKSDMIGKKILATGNGRCNLSNKNVCEQFYSDKFFAKKILDQFDFEDLICFFNDIGLEVFCDDFGRCYPVSNCASSVLDCLKLKIKSLNIDLKTNQTVVDVQKNADCFVVKTANEQFCFDKVIVCVCNKASEILSGFNLKFSEEKPALVGFKTNKKEICGLSGIRAFAKVHYLAHESFGEVQFKDDGISGICVMDISCFLDKNKSNLLTLDLLPQIDLEVLKSKLQIEKKNNSYLTIENLLIGFFHKKLARLILKRAGVVDFESKIENLNDAQLDKICEVAKKFKIEILGTYNNPQVLRGGIKTNELGNDLMIKNVSGLYVCGEAIDIVGLCGGFNLHFAFACGKIAGTSVCQD
ncbi:MAG: aminoacetone oxidase family FAD-binding enzyme [Clostridia bacterium]